MLTREFVEAMPKVELHVHLEGATQPGTYLKLAEKNGVVLPATTEEGMREWFKFTGFPHFVEVYVACSKTIQRAEDLELIAEEFAREQARQNILYTEATYTASTIFKYAGIPGDEQMQALQSGFAKVPETKVNLVLDIVKEMDQGVGEWVSELCQKHVGKGVVAIGLSGMEANGKASTHSAAIREAMKKGVRMTAHAGETCGPEVVWEVLQDADAERIGHGVRCLEDPKLVAHLRDNQMHLEVNPTSNVCIGVFPSLSEHPLPRLMDEGLNVSINSDDPPFFNTTLTDELWRCAEEFEFSADTIYSLTQNAARNAFLGPEEKRSLLADIATRFSALQS